MLVYLVRSVNLPFWEVHNIAIDLVPVKKVIIKMTLFQNMNLVSKKKLFVPLENCSDELVVLINHPLNIVPSLNQ